MADTTTIRVRVQTRDLLRDLAQRRHGTVSGLVDELAREADERTLLEQAAAGWARMAAQADSLGAYRDEAAAWETTLGDGLHEQ